MVLVRSPVRRVGELVVTTEAKVFGAVLMEQRRVMRRLVGDAVFERALDAIPLERRDEYDALSLLGWCRASTATAVTRAVAEQAGRVPAAFVREVVVAGFGTVLRTVWRILMTNSSDEALVRRAGTLYSKAVDKGSLTIARDTATSVVLDITGWPEMDDLDIVALTAGVEAALLAAGRTGVRMSSVRTPEGTRVTAKLGAPSERPPGGPPSLLG